MPGPASKAVPSILQKLILRGERASTRAADAIRTLQVVIGESLELRRRIDQIHHTGPHSFDALLGFYQAEEVYQAEGAGARIAVPFSE